MTQDVLKQALEALKDVGVLTDREWQAVHKNKANELRQAIAELESQEPFCFFYVENGEEYFAPKGAYVPDNAQPLYTTPPQRTEQNFCPRCGKRTKDLTHIHTCTPPQD
jgi:Cu2+-containing amine oxidase